MPIVLDKSLLQEDGTASAKVLNWAISKHVAAKARFDMLADYYDGEHKIKIRQMSDSSLPNNKLVCNHAEYITDMATGYFIGNPVSYKGTNIEPILKLYKSNVIDNVDVELCRDISKFGIGFELIYMTSDEVPVPKSTNIDPRNIFIVVDNTVEYKTLFAVHYYAKETLDSTDGYYVNVYYADKVMKYHFKDLEDANPTLLSEDPLFFQATPVIEYWNKSNMKGDYEGVLSLIDAYNLLQSDRVNDKEQLVDALLALIGVSLGDNETEMSNTAKLLKKHKMLEMPEGADAKWLVKQLVETEVEVLKKAIKDDIHEFSKVPCLTDENFASQASGVSMKYKLMGMEQLAKTKEGYYKIGLMERLKLYAAVFNTKGMAVNTSDVTITMKRSLPANEVEISNMVVNLDGTVSLETRLSLLPFVEDPAGELKKVTAEKAEAVKLQREAFSNYPEGQGDVNATE